MIIFSSGVGGESVARELSKKIRNCQHGDRRSSIVEAELLLGKAENLAEAAHRLIDRDVSFGRADAAYARAEELIECLSECTDEINHLFAEADGFELDAKSAAEAAQTLLGDEVVDLTSPASDDVVTRVEDTVQSARTEIRKIGQAAPRRTLKAHLDGLVARLVALRSRLTEGKQ
ncbi:hypothetical protein [Catellatospora sichuanensis]|uniref:hypothetical protein n=1 Tax=Catellatospora sichuanensis TaxID=1969805 RepID=UPI0011839641|nr:hypothetical protein [Catellatospora sichuanensis]